MKNRTCIHGRTEKQRCKLCDLRSKCCQAPVTVEGHTTHYYVCTNCGQPCDCGEK